MKKQFLFLVVMLLSMTLNAQSTVKIDDIYYNLNAIEQTAEVSFMARYRYSGDVVIPSSVTYEGVDYSVTGIADRVFVNSTDLTSVSIPASVTSIGYNLFQGCTNLTSIVVENGNPKFDSRENSNAIIETASDKLLLGCKNTIIPSSVTSIANNAFTGCSGLTSIIIPNGVTDIGESAFSGCSDLASITIGSGVASIGKNAFQDCSNLTKVELNSNAIVSIGYKYESMMSIKDIFGTQVKEYVLGEDVTSIGDGAFYYCINLTSVHMSDNVTSIGKHAFDNCDKLTTIKMSDNLTSIGEFAFSGCFHLASITIPSGVTSIDRWTFSGCIEIKKVEINSNAIVSKDYYSTSSLTGYFGGQVEEIVLGEEVTSIGQYAFSGSTRLTSINIPNSVTTIGQYAFSGCTGLTSINIPNSVTTIDDYAFAYCTGMTSITISKSVTNIGYRAFSGCSDLTAIHVESGNTVYDSREDCNAIIETDNNTLVLGCQNTIIPNSVTTLGEYAFGGCTSLISVTIPESVTNIGRCAFMSCTGLTSITIPNSVSSIEFCTFVDCYNLATVVIPNSVTSVGDGAFLRTGLKDMYYYAEQVPETGSNIFDYSNCNATLHVPAVAVDAYGNAEQWKDFASIVALTDSDPNPTGVISPTAVQQPAAEVQYDLSGRRISQPHRGVNIVKMSDGTTKKVIVK